MLLPCLVERLRRPWLFLFHVQPTTDAPNERTCDYFDICSGCMSFETSLQHAHAGRRLNHCRKSTKICELVSHAVDQLQLPSDDLLYNSNVGFRLVRDVATRAQRANPLNQPSYSSSVPGDAAGLYVVIKFLLDLGDRPVLLE